MSNNISEDKTILTIQDVIEVSESLTITGNSGDIIQVLNLPKEQAI